MNDEGGKTDKNETKLSLSLHPHLYLSAHLERRQALLAEEWEKRNEEEKAYAPSAIKDTLSPGEYQEQMKEYIDFVSTQVIESLPSKGTVIAFGYGRGYDKLWITEALKRHLKVLIFDVHPIACTQAKLDLNQIAVNLGLHHRKPLLDIVHNEEMLTLLNSGFTGYRLVKPVRFMLSRILSSQRPYAAKKSLQLLGGYLSHEADPEKENSVFLVHPLSELNKDIQWERTRPYSSKMIATNLTVGAQRPVRLYIQGEHRYFGYKTVFAILAKAS